MRLGSDPARSSRWTSPTPTVRADDDSAARTKGKEADEDGASDFGSRSARVEDEIAVALQDEARARAAFSGGVAGPQNLGGANPLVQDEISVSLHLEVGGLVRRE